jgi:hypothetical protein
MENNTYFPPNITSSGVLHEYQSDFTIRDHFAALAMQGAISTSGAPWLSPDTMLAERLAAMAYDVAEAMMKARQL